MTRYPSHRHTGATHLPCPPEFPGPAHPSQISAVRVHGRVSQSVTTPALTCSLPSSAFTTHVWCSPMSPSYTGARQSLQIQSPLDSIPRPAPILLLTLPPSEAPVRIPSPPPLLFGHHHPFYRCTTVCQGQAPPSILASQPTLIPHLSHPSKGPTAHQQGTPS